jgi:hypothetical protein
LSLYISAIVGWQHAIFLENLFDGAILANFLEQNTHSESLKSLWILATAAGPMLLSGCHPYLLILQSQLVILMRCSSGFAYCQTKSLIMHGCSKEI